jgi:AmiR/NasT family two-component response regulator
LSNPDSRLTVDETLAYATDIVMRQHGTCSDRALLILALAAVDRGVTVSRIAAEVIADQALTRRPHLA